MDCRAVVLQVNKPGGILIIVIMWRAPWRTKIITLVLILSSIEEWQGILVKGTIIQEDDSLYDQIFIHSPHTVFIQVWDSILFQKLKGVYIYIYSWLGLKTYVTRNFHLQKKPSTYSQCCQVNEVKMYRLFWGNEGICALFTEARSAEVNEHISPRCLKITYLFFTLRGRVNESE
jgi:hypothetical protein